MGASFAGASGRNATLREASFGAAASARVGGLVVVLVAFGALTAFLAASLNIWQDEWYSLRTTSHGFAFAWRSALGFEALPPLYPLLLEAWRTLDGSVWFARWFSILCVAGAVVCAWSFAARHLRATSPAVVAAALAFNPFAIYAAVEIRLYALALLFSAGLILTYFDGFIAAAPSRFARVAFVFCALGVLYTQYYPALLLAGAAAALLLLHDRRALRNYGIAVACVVVGALPVLAFLPAQMGGARTLAMSTRPDIVSPVETALSFALPHGWLSNWWGYPTNGVYDAALLATVGVAIATRPRLTRANLTLGAIAVTLVACFALVPLVLHEKMIFPRHGVALLIPSVLAVFAVLDAAPQPRLRHIALATYVSLYAILTALTLWSTYHALAKSGDFRRAAAYLDAHASAEQTIFVFDPEMVGPLRFYYHGPARIVALPQAMNFTRFNPPSFTFTSAAQAAVKLGAVAPGRTIFLYRGDVCNQRGDAFGCRFLDAEVTRDYRVLTARPLYSASIQELLRRGDATRSRARHRKLLVERLLPRDRSHAR
ncbi:MAG: glycosyltransferase family 39 protein [Candidatus Eremiobacteraeota bacterium]|nr:glycosyltransferase family 39 protein [Candidatus Eremiobacteraeota bacterium]MBC5801431.1 glycosyltransferase family 39 protein [Candidatus Eremiobacteraeota bacterium]MBC5821480.1 glycosyltransferase family 39 protein [Candidatus Eremiobacteraeota bacterium]